MVFKEELSYLSNCHALGLCHSHITAVGVDLNSGSKHKLTNKKAEVANDNVFLILSIAGYIHQRGQRILLQSAEPIICIKGQLSGSE